MVTFKIETETDGTCLRSVFCIGGKRFSRICLVYQGQRVVWERPDGTLHARRSQPRRGPRHVYTRKLQYIFFSPKIGQFVSALIPIGAPQQLFQGRLQRRNTYGVRASGGLAFCVPLATRRRPWGVPTLNSGVWQRIQRSRTGVDCLLPLEQEYQAAIKGHPRLSKRYNQMEPTNA
jgi:hypothetical protein